MNGGGYKWRVAHTDPARLTVLYMTGGNGPTRNGSLIGEYQPAGLNVFQNAMGDGPFAFLLDANLGRERRLGVDHDHPT